MATLLAAATDSDDEVKILVALRKRLAEQIDDTNSARDVSSLSKQLVDVSARLAEVRKAARKQGRGTALDELAKRRAARSGAAAAN